MLKIIVSVKDVIADIFNDPRSEINAASAIRAFEHSVKESPHKDDYSLYQIGTMDTCNGTITANEPVRLCTGHDVKINNVTDIPDMLQKQSGEN